jgi:hypothetical protein
VDLQVAVLVLCLVQAIPRKNLKRKQIADKYIIHVFYGVTHEKKRI